MKKVIKVIVGLLLMASACYAYQASVTTTGTKIVPARKIKAKNLTDWVAATNYVNGQYAEISGGAWMCLVAGTSGAVEPVSGSESMIDSNVTWVKSVSSARVMTYITKTVGTSDVYLGMGTMASNTSGVILFDNEDQVVLEDSFNGEISAISASATNTLNITDK